ncbi:MAG TPA: TolC family protein [Gemmatimonadales bacterium]|nr:TolC family protein [Gemmatimonadales bacterium]
MTCPRWCRAGGVRWSLLLCLLAAPASAQGTQTDSTLTLAAAIRLALATHPSVGAATAALDEASAARGEAAATRWPSLHLASSVTRFQEPMLVTPIHGFVPGQTPPFDETLIQAGATVGYTLFDGGARGARIAQARARSEVASATLDASEQTLIATVVATYVGALARQEILAAHDQRLAALEAEQTRVEQLLAVGRAAEVDRLRANAALAEARAARVRLAQDLDFTERTLGRLVAERDLHATDLVPIHMPDEPPTDREELVTRAMRASPVVEQARRQVAAASAGISIARGLRRPEVRLIGNYIDRGSAAGDFRAEWNAGIQLAYPLFTGGTVERRVERATATRSGAEQALKLAELEVTGLVDQSLGAIREARARAASLEQAVAGFTEVARIEQLRLATEVGTQAEYFRAEADLLTVRAELAGARYAEITARAELARAVGCLSPSWVATNLGGGQ